LIKLKQKKQKSSY